MISAYDSGSIYSEDVFLCLPGFLETAIGFDEFVKLVAQDHRAITIDYAGRGHSERLENFDQYKMSTCLADVTALVAYALGIEIAERRRLFPTSKTKSKPRPRIHLVGNSMGGLLAIAFAAQFPGMTETIILNDVGVMVPWSGLFSMIGTIGRSVSLSSDSFLKSRLEEVAMELDVDPKLLRSTMTPEYADLAFEKNIQGLSFHRSFSRIKEPMLLIHSSESPLVNTTVLQHMANLNAETSYLTVEGDLHPVRYSESVVKSILDFVAKPPQQNKPTVFL